MNKRLGKRTLQFETPPSVLSHACVVGKKEGQGPLKDTFDYIYDDNTCGEKSWEKAETRLQQDALDHALNKGGIPREQVEILLAGDLINQNIISSFGSRGMECSYLGVFGACSTMAEGLGLAATLIDGGFATTAAAVTSSHFCTAERQFRMPLEYGGQRPPSSQWTVTGSGAVILGTHDKPPYLSYFCPGIIVDAGITDANNMGAAMAPAAYDTLRTFFTDTGTTPSDFDHIFTGDLGKIGHEIVCDFFQKDGVTLGDRYEDCGMLIFGEDQDVHAGASGCGCAASVLCGHILNKLESGEYQRVLFAPTGALMNSTSVQQGESIPGICHCLVLEGAPKGQAERKA